MGHEPELQLERNSRVLLCPKFGNQGWEPFANSQQAMHASVAPMAKGNQAGSRIPARHSMMDRHAFPLRANPAALGIALQDFVAISTEEAEGMTALLVATGAKTACPRSVRAAAEAEEHPLTAWLKRRL